MMVGSSCSMGSTPGCQEPLFGPPHFLSAMSTVCRSRVPGSGPPSNSLTGPRGIAC
ncbi:uncharacterized protein P884DRAFT_258387, partial [Thermothelomyces heterothallicus CBS 202.75]|uniref:uncharacterized protein n=1 Tax=Thermothelomyces heterothallicus CBS 202.75 TaxID=1149848 RepID=UPI0037424D73